MSGIEGGGLNKLKSRRDASLNLPPEEPMGPSMKELLADDNFNVFLSAELKRSGAPLFKRLTEGTTTPKDEEKLIGLQKTYFERSKNGEAVIGTIEDYMAQMLKESPVLKDLVQLHGSETIEKALKEGLLKRALTDPKKFAVLQDEFKKLRDFENNVEKPLNKRLDEWCKKNNISIDDEKLNEALLEKNPGLRQAWIQDELTKGMKLKQRAWDGVKGIFGGGTRGEARRLSNENIPQILAQRDQIVKDAGEYARNLLVNDKEFQGALARMRVDEEPAFEGSGASMMKFEDVKSFKFDGKAANTEFDKFLKVRGAALNRTTLPKEWFKLTPDEKETFRGEFWNGVEDTDPDKSWKGYRETFERPKGGGIMRTLLSFIFGKDYYKNPEFVKALE